MKVIVTSTYMRGGHVYQSSPRPQNYPDDVAKMLIDADVAYPVEQKPVNTAAADPAKKKPIAPPVEASEEATISVSPPDQAPPKATPKKRGRPRRKQS